MNDQSLTTEERRILLALARASIERASREEPLPRPDLESLPPRLRENGATFVTITMPGDELRGCIGGLEATQPLAYDVISHAAAAATEDYRFLTVLPEEVPQINIEISRLTQPYRLTYGAPEELLRLLRPQVDGVILRDGPHRATFLPQVWEKLPDPVVFLDHLCDKMGAPRDLWRRKPLTVETYQVEEFQESDFKRPSGLWE